MKAKTRRILAAVPTNGPDGRFRSVGILLYANRHPNWHVNFFTSRTMFNDREVESFKADGIDGCILAAYTPAIEPLVRAGLPCVVVLDNIWPSLATAPKCRAVLVDNAELGRAAAEHFKSLGMFKSYAFIPASPKIPWSLERQTAFQNAVNPRVPFLAFQEEYVAPVNLSGENHMRLDADRLKEFLSALPKPAAVLGANDILAAQVLLIARAARIRVPDELSVIGCDNDELLCLGSRPTLTSLLPDFESAGFAAAKLLDELMHGKNPSREPMRIGKTRLFERGSTSYLSSADVLVSLAMQYIKHHATEGISTADVVAQLRVSRSLLDLRFRQVRKDRVMDAILAVRLDAVKRMLMTTDRQIRGIGRACGFGNADYLKRLFKNRTGMTMTEFRARG